MRIIIICYIPTTSMLRWNNYLDFFKVCDVLHFELDFVDCAITLVFEDKGISNSNEQFEYKEFKSEIAEKIKVHFDFFSEHCPRRHKQILKDEDFEKLIKWTEFYYENQFEVPEINEPIGIINTNKTFVQLAFKYLFKELHKSSPYPKSLFEFYKRAFLPYSDDKRHSFEGVRNNDEVKKLMKIAY